MILAVIRQVPSEYVLFLGWEPEGESLCYFFCPSATNQILSEQFHVRLGGVWTDFGNVGNFI